MIKTLKWVYELGYKHAENKLYHILTNEINKKQQDFDYLVTQSKPDKDELERLEATRYRLQFIVDNVFKPNVAGSVEYFERNKYEL